jgi:hypothetical protein
VHAQQEPDRRRLPGSVRPEVAIYLAFAHVEIELVQRERRSVPL